MKNNQIPTPNDKWCYSHNCLLSNCLGPHSIPQGMSAYCATVLKPGMEKHQFTIPRNLFFDDPRPDISIRLCNQSNNGLGKSASALRLSDVVKDFESGIHEVCSVCGLSCVYGAYVTDDGVRRGYCGHCYFHPLRDLMPILVQHYYHNTLVRWQVAKAVMREYDAKVIEESHLTTGDIFTNSDEDLEDIIRKYRNWAGYIAPAMARDAYRELKERHMKKSTVDIANQIFKHTHNANRKLANVIEYAKSEYPDNEIVVVRSPKEFAAAAQNKKHSIIIYHEEPDMETPIKPISDPLCRHCHYPWRIMDPSGFCNHTNYPNNVCKRCVELRERRR